MPVAKYLVPVLALCALTPWVSSGVALLFGAALALTLGNPHAALTRKISARLLPLSVVGLGAGMHLDTVARAGAYGAVYTAVGIVATLALAAIIGRTLKTERSITALIGVGTAICGGSAIAAAAPVLNAKQHDISVALAVVFLLNAAALFLFPAIGHMVGLTQEQFGLWAALAIHDTSSVVGAGMQYGPQALAVGTTVKLARALWIVPLVLLLDVWQRRTGAAAHGPQKRKYPFFILGFLAVSAIVTFLPAMAPAGAVLEQVARRTLVVTLFLIGANLSKDALKTVGVRPLALGVILWVLVASCSLAAIRAGWLG